MRGCQQSGDDQCQPCPFQAYISHNPPHHSRWKPMWKHFPVEKNTNTQNPAEVWLGSGLLQGQGHWLWQCLQGTFERGRHYLHCLHHSLASGQTTGREHSPAHQQEIGLKIYWAWPRPSEQDPVSPSVSLSHQEASISLLPLSIRGQTEWKLHSQKTQTHHMDHSLV